MKIKIYKEKNVLIDIENVINIINSLSKTIILEEGSYSFNFNTDIREDNFENYISDKIKKESKDNLFTIYITLNEINGNMFFFSNKKENHIILSFYKWENLTKYTKETGLFYFIIDMLSLEIDPSNARHNKKSTSCIFGYAENKKDIDKKIKKAYMCEHCQERIIDTNDTQKELILNDMITLLDESKKASNYQNIVEYWGMKENQKVRVFLSYSHKDRVFLNEFKEYINIFERNGLIERWDDNELLPGEKWDDIIEEKMNKVDIVIFLISSSSLCSDYIHDNELKVAREMNENGGAYIVPILVKDCLWEMTPFKEFQILPLDAQAVNSWEKKEEAWSHISRELRKLFDKLIDGKTDADKKSKVKPDKNMKKDNNTSDEELLVEEFLRIYSRWWFNIARIKNWGSQRPEFKTLKNISKQRYEIYLNNLIKNEKVLMKTSSKNKDSVLYKYND